MISGLLGKFKFIIVAFLAGLLIGGITGWYEKSLRVSAAALEVVNEVRKEDAAQIGEVQNKQVELDKAKTEIRVETRYITKEIEKYVPVTASQDEDKSQDYRLCNSPTLSLGAVWLLNAARTGEVVDPSTWVNEEAIQPTEIGLQELSVSDAELAGECRELLKDHQTLVESVEEYQAYQRESLGIK